MILLIFLDIKEIDRIYLKNLYLMKSITFLICTLSSGGAEHQLIYLSNFLVSRGYSVTIATFGDAQDHYKVHNEVIRDRIAPCKSSMAKFLYITKYLLFNDASYIVSFGHREGFFSLLAMLLKPFKRFIVCERSLSSDHEPVNLKIINCLLYYRANFVVPNSQSQSDFILLHYPFIIEKVRTIQNYTDLNHYSMLPYPDNKIIKIGVFARYSEVKNYRRFVKVVANLRDKGYCFLIDWYGNQSIKGGYNPYYIDMKCQIEALGLRNVVNLFDHVGDIKSVMLCYDAICLPSLKEGFSNAISEAICSGKPMLVSRVSDNPVMVQEGVNGFLFDPTNDEDMCLAFEHFFKTTKEERKLMSQNSRRIAEGLFDANVFVSKYIRLIES